MLQKRFGKVYEKLLGTVASVSILPWIPMNRTVDPYESYRVPLNRTVEYLATFVHGLRLKHALRPGCPQFRAMPIISVYLPCKVTKCSARPNDSGLWL